MYRRKLIKQGKGGITVSLPIAWIRKRGLQPGDTVVVQEQYGELVIGGSGNAQREKRLFCRHLSKTQLRTILATQYRSGHTKIILAFSSQADRKKILAAARTLPHCKATFIAKECVLQLEGKDLEPYSVLLNRMFLQLQELCSCAMQQCKPKDLKQQQRAVLMLRDECQRAIILQSDIKSHELFTLAVALEKTGPHILRAAERNALHEIQKFSSLLRMVHRGFLNQKPRIIEQAYQKAHAQMNSRKDAPLFEYLFIAASRLHIMYESA